MDGALLGGHLPFHLGFAGEIEELDPVDSLPPQRFGDDRSETRASPVGDEGEGILDGGEDPEGADGT